MVSYCLVGSKVMRIILRHFIPKHNVTDMMRNIIVLYVTCLKRQTNTNGMNLLFAAIYSIFPVFTDTFLIRCQWKVKANSSLCGPRHDRVILSTVLVLY